jgi:phospholipase/carboxylesterase
LAAVFAPVVGSCQGVAGTVPAGLGNARLRARPRPPTVDARIGASALDLSPGRDGLLYVPASYDPQRPHPLLVALHGAGGQAADWTGFYTAAEDRGLILLIPESRGTTWDRVRGSFGPDVAFIDRALTQTFEQVHVDPSRLALAGFSDGASYALSLGLGNGDVFSNLVAFSPGFVDTGPEPVGKPRVFVSHGIHDGVLPVRLSRDGIVPTLREAGYEVRYEEFEGRHEVPAEIGGAALDWLLA